MGGGTVIETIDEREFGGRHRQPAEGRRVPRSGRRGPRPDDQPTEQLPRTELPEDRGGAKADPDADDTVRDAADVVEDEYDEYDDDYDDENHDDEYHDDVDDTGDVDEDAADEDAADEDAADEDEDDGDAARTADRADNADNPADAVNADAVNAVADTVQHPVVSDPVEPSAGEPDERAAPVARPAEPAVAQRRVDRKRTQPRRRPLLRVVVVVAVLAVVGLVVWAIGAALAGPDATSAQSATQLAVPSHVAFGETVERADGWAIKISRPSAARTVSAAELPAGADRAVQLEVTLTNTSAAARDSAGWTIKATADARAVELIPADAGVVASRTIRPGSSLTFTVAVPLPSDHADLQLEAAPAGGAPVLFVGLA
jgi:hypothetical protein